MLNNNNNNTGRVSERGSHPATKWLSGAVSFFLLFLLISIVFLTACVRVRGFAPCTSSLRA